MKNSSLLSAFIHSFTMKVWSVNR